DWADDSTHKVFSKARIDKDGAKVLLRRLCDPNAAQIPDFDSARQIIFAFQVVYAEWDPKHQKDREVKETLAKLESELDLWSSSRKDEGREERKQFVRKRVEELAKKEYAAKKSPILKIVIDQLASKDGDPDAALELAFANLSNESLRE